MSCIVFNVRIRDCFWVYSYFPRDLLHPTQKSSGDVRSRVSRRHAVVGAYGTLFPGFTFLLLFKSIMLVTGRDNTLVSWPRKRSTFTIFSCKLFYLCISNRFHQARRIHGTSERSSSFAWLVSLNTSPPLMRLGVIPCEVCHRSSDGRAQGHLQETHSICVSLHGSNNFHVIGCNRTHCVVFDAVRQPPALRRQVEAIVSGCPSRRFSYAPRRTR